MSQASNVEVVAIKDVGATGAKCLTSYRAELTVPWSYSMPDPAPAVGEVWTVERLNGGIWAFRDKVRGGGFQALRYAMRLDARACAGRERSVADDVATSGVDGVVLTVASGGVLSWESALGDFYGEDGAWHESGYGLRQHGDHVTELLDRLVSNGLWVYLAVDMGVWCDAAGKTAASESQARFQQLDSFGRRHAKASPTAAAGAVSKMVGELAERYSDKVRGVFLDGIGYATPDCDFSGAAMDACKAKRGRELDAAWQEASDKGSLAPEPRPDKWRRRGEFDEDREAAWAGLRASVASAAHGLPVCATVDAACLCPNRSGGRSGRLACGVGDSFGQGGWSVVGMDMDFSRAPDLKSEMRSLEVSVACLQRLASPATPMYFLDMRSMENFGAAFDVLNRYGASMCCVGDYDDWRQMSDARQRDLRDAIGSNRVSTSPTDPFIAVLMSSSSRDAAFCSPERSASWTEGFYDFCSEVMDRLPHRLKVLFDSDVEGVSPTGGWSALGLWMASCATDDAVEAVEELVGSAVPVVSVGAFGRYSGRSLDKRRDIPLAPLIGTPATTRRSQYVSGLSVSAGTLDVEGSAYMLDGQADAGQRMAHGGTAASGSEMTVSKGDDTEGSGGIKTVSTDFPLTVDGTGDAWLGVDCDMDGSLVGLAGELMIRACSRAGSLKR